MRAAYVSSFAADHPGSAVTVGERPAPEPAAGWSVIDVRAASVNQHDVFVARGYVSAAQSLPLILGMDVAGTDADGNEVVLHALFNDPSWFGDELLDPGLSGLTEHGNHGGFAEQVRVPTRNCIPKPAALSFEEAACLPTAWLTAFRMLFTKAGVGPGDTVLVQGAAGGVASASIALGAAAGLRMWATGRTAEKRAFAEQLGAERTFEPGARLPSRVDAVLETVGEPTFAHSMASVRRGGTIVVAGGTGGYLAPLRIDQTFIRNLTITGSTMGTLDELRRLTAFMAQKDLRPSIDGVLSIEETAVAIGRMHAGDVRGKLVLVP